MMVEEIKAKSVTAQRVIEARLKDEAEMAKRLGMKKREVEDTLRDVVEEKAMYAAALERALAEKERLEEELTDVRGEVVHLQEQASNRGLMVASALSMGRGASSYEEAKGGDYMDAILGATMERTSVDVDQSY